MSVTVTTNSTANTSLSILGDYELHHSEQSEPAPANSQPTSPVQQPANWPVNYRRVPSYRPINHHLDQNERPAGSNRVEWAFIGVMLHGVWMNSVVSRYWRKTGGRVSDRLFHYKIGGEW